MNVGSAFPLIARRCRAALFLLTDAIDHQRTHRRKLDNPQFRVRLAIGRPCVHEFSAQFQNVSSAISSLDRVSNRVSHSLFDRGVRKPADLLGPGAERCANPCGTIGLLCTGSTHLLSSVAFMRRITVSNAMFENGLSEALLGNTKLDDRTAAISWTMVTARGDSGIRIGSDRCLRSLSLSSGTVQSAPLRSNSLHSALKAASVLTFVRIKNSNVRAGGDGLARSHRGGKFRHSGIGQGRMPASAERSRFGKPLRLHIRPVGRILQYDDAMFGFQDHPSALENSPDRRVEFSCDLRFRIPKPVLEPPPHPGSKSRSRAAGATAHNRRAPDVEPTGILPFHSWIAPEHQR